MKIKKNEDLDVILAPLLYNPDTWIIYRTNGAEIIVRTNGKQILSSSKKLTSKEIKAITEEASC